MSKTNFAFFGTHHVSALTLHFLKEKGFMPSLIVSSPDKPQGRKMLIVPTLVKQWAEENNIKCIQPEKLNKEDFENDFDLFLVVAYGKIIAEEILNIPKYGSFNVHYSLLPKYRGASPIESAILNGDTETGISIQKMVYKMDAGPIVAQEHKTIGFDEKSEELRGQLIEDGAKLLIETIPHILDGSITETPQDEALATHCKKIKKEDGLIDLNENATKNYNKFRAYATWPRSFFFIDDKRIIITDATLEDGKFIIKKVLPEGKKEISYGDFLKSCKI